MKFKTKYLVKRIFAMALVVAMLWSDSSFVSLAQTIAGENEESLETILTETGEGEESAPVEDQEEDPADTPAEPTEEPADPTQEPAEPTETPAEPTEEPSAVPVETPEGTETPMPSEIPEGEETPVPLATPSMTPAMDDLELVAVPGEERFDFRIDDSETNWPDSGEKVTAASTIRIFDNETKKVLTNADLKEIEWSALWIDQEGAEPYELSNDATLELSQHFFPFKFTISVTFTLKDDEYLDHTLKFADGIEPSETTLADKAKLEVEELPLPGFKLCLEEEDAVEEWNCFFIRADDEEGTNSVCVKGGETFYDIQEEDDGKYIYAKYAVRDEEGQMTARHTAAVHIGYSREDTDDAKRANAELLQQHIEKLAEFASEHGQQWLSIPEGVQIIADEPIILYDGVTLYSEAWPDMNRDDENTVPTFTGSIQVKKYEKNEKPVGEARIENLFLDFRKNGTVIDASSDVCVVLDNCRFDINENATFLKVSKDSYARTEINNSAAYFSQGGTLLNVEGDSSMPSVFKLGNTHFKVQVENNNVTMLSAPDGVKWNVDNLEPRDWDSVGKLLPGEPVNVINNVFGVDGASGMVSNSKELTVDSAAYKWISYDLPGDKGSFSDGDAKIIVEPNDDSAGKYEVTDIPKEEGAFRPYAVTGTYAAGTGSYSKLLPAGYVTYIVVDVNQKNGFPYGAIVGKEIETNLSENFVVIQYHKDKSVETAASVISGDIRINYNSALADLSIDGNGKCRISVKTDVKGEPVAEPIVLAVYKELPGANAKLSVYEEEVYYDNEDEEDPIKTQEVLSDGKILTNGEKKVSFRLNEGIATNDYVGEAFTVDKSKCHIPEGKNIAANILEGNTEADLIIPEGTYGTLTITAHYKSASAAKATDIPYTLQLTSIGDIKGIVVDSANAGKKYYGTAEFNVLSGESKPFLGVKAQNREGECHYNLKIMSSSVSGSKVTVQYMLDLRSENSGIEAWEDMLTDPPYLMVETTAGVWGIELETTGSEITVKDEDSGLLYLFDLEDDHAVYTGARIIDSDSFYVPNTPTCIAIPAKVNVERGEYAVTAMAKGCLNEFYEGGYKVEAPDIVRIPASVTDIRGPLVTDKNYSYLRQIVVDKGNTVYCSYGSSDEFAVNESDDAAYCALYKKNGGTTELVEIASDYEGDLLWRSDAVWTDDTYKLDFSKITGFRCEYENGTSSYKSLDRILVKEEGTNVTVIKVPEKMGTAVVLPEGITSIKAKALEKTAVDTLVLPSTMTTWEAGALTQAKNIYVYNNQTNINPVSGIDSSLKGITFYGFTDQNGYSALKSWVASFPKGQNYKFVAMTASNDQGSDYTVKTLRNAIKSYKGIEYYEIFVGEELTETFDFDIVSKMTNGYPGKTDVDVVWVQDDDKYGQEQGEFVPDTLEDGREILRAVSPGVAKVEIKKGDTIVKTAYFAVRPNYFEIQGEDWLEIPLGTTKEITAIAYVYDSKTDTHVEYSLSENTLKEYEELGALRVVTPKEREVSSEEDAWQINRVESEQEGEQEDGAIVYRVTPLLGKDSNGNIKGESSEFILELFGESRSVWIETATEGEGNLFPGDDNWNPLMVKGQSISIPIMLRPWEDEDQNQVTDKALDYNITINGTQYPQVSCEVISGSKVVDAAIIEQDGKAYLKLTAKADGKAQVRVYTPYAQNGGMDLTVAVGKDLVGSFALTLWNDKDNNELHSSISSIYEEDEIYQYVFDINEKDDNGNPIWKEVISVSDIIDTTGESPSELSSGKLNWTVSDTTVAELVKDTKDKNKVTGIKLKGEGTVLITAAVKDTNGAAIRMLFTVKDFKPGLYNDSASLDTYKTQDAAEYVFAVPYGVDITGTESKSVILNKKGVTDDIRDKFVLEYDDQNNKVLVRINEDSDSKPAAGKYILTFAVTVTYDADGDGEKPSLQKTYEYPVTLQVNSVAPKAAVTSSDTIDLSIPSKRKSALTVTVGDVVNGEGTEITLNIADTTTNDFSKYFKLEKNAGEYSVIFNNANGKAPADIVKLFNNKKIKLTVISADYGDYQIPAEVSFKITATTPVLKAAGGGKVTVNTADFTAFDGNAYTAGLSYTLTEGFDLLSNEDGFIDMVIADKQKAYEDQIDFWQAGEEILVAVAPGVPKGTYTFTWTPKVKAFSGEKDTENFAEDDIYTEGQTLKSQKISVVVTTSTAKATLSSSKVTVNTNYRFTEEETCLQFDESQIRTLYGRSYWMECLDGERIKDSITLVKGPKGITQENSQVAFEVYDNRICVSAEEGAAVGEYKYSVTPYVIVGTNVEVAEGDWQDIFVPMALTPINFSVQVTNTLPTASLAQNTVTIDNNDLSSRILIKWNVKGNYQYIVGPWSNNEDGNKRQEEPEFKISYENGNGPENGPVIYLEGDDIRVQATEDTLKGTYKFTIAPQVVLDSGWIPDDEDSESGTDVQNTKTLAPVTLTVKVNSTRPTVKLEKSTLTVNNSYPGEGNINEYGMFENVPAVAVTEINSSNGYGIGGIEVVPADAGTKAIDADNTKKITFLKGKYPGDNNIHCFAAIPTTDTPKGTYNYLVYAWNDDDSKEDNRGKALEPVKLKVTVKDEKPKLQLSSSSIQLPAGREGRADITLQGQTEFVSNIAEKTEYLVNIGGKWQLTDDETGDAYARLDTAEDGSITVTSLGKTDVVNKAIVTYTQATCLIGNTESYNASYQLTFNLTSADPKAVLSAKTITVNKNFNEWVQEGNQVKLTLNNGEKIVRYDIVDANKGDKQNVIRLAQIDEESDEYGITYRSYFAKPDKVVKGKYTFKLTPYVSGTNGNDKALSPVDLTVDVTDALPTVSASQTKVTINKLDPRENTWQFIHLKPSFSYEEVRYDVTVTKGPKGVDLLDINFFPEGWDICDETDLILSSVDTQIPDGSYTVTVTPYTWVNGQRKDLKSINIAVTVTSPKITAALQASKVTIDVATEGTVFRRNSILLTGTNADMISRIHWDWKLTKKPKGAEDDSIWIEDRWEEEDDTDGKEFAICWGDRRNNDKFVNVMPGTYEFTLTPVGLETHDNRMNLSIPGAMKLTVTVKNSMPTVKYGKTASKMNFSFVNEENTFVTLSDTSWHLEDVDAVMTSWPKGAGEERSDLYMHLDGDRLFVRGRKRVPEGTYTFTLEPRVKKNDIEMSLKEQKYTVTVKNEIPTAKASSGKLTCNVLYTGDYWFEGNPEDNFNKKQQTKLTLSKNYGSSHFEDIKIAFTGKTAQQAEAAKIDWCFYEDGTIAAKLPWGSSVDVGSYSFEITPVIRSDEADVKMALKPVKITVVVENKAIKATAKASGKIDLLSRDESGITYNVTLSDKDADAIEWIEIVSPEKGNDESWRFWLEQDEEDPAKCIVRANDGEELSTKVNYEMRLAVHTKYNKTYYVPVKIKPTQSKLTVKSDVTAVTLFKQGSYDTAAVAEIKATINNTPSGEMQVLCTEDGELVSGNADFRVCMLPREDSPAEGEDAEDGEEVIEGEEKVEVEAPKSAKVKIQFASEQAKGKYKAGSKVTLPIYVNVYNQATDTYNTVKVNMTVNIKN